MDDAAASPEASRRYSLGARNESLRTLLLTNPVLSKAAIRRRMTVWSTPSQSQNSLSEIAKDLSALDFVATILAQSRQAMSQAVNGSRKLTPSRQVKSDPLVSSSLR